MESVLDASHYTACKQEQRGEQKTQKEPHSGIQGEWTTMSHFGSCPPNLKPYRHTATLRVRIAWSTRGQRVRDSGDDHRRAMTGDRGKHEGGNALVFPDVHLLQMSPRSAKNGERHIFRRMWTALICGVQGLASPAESEAEIVYFT